MQSSITSEEHLQGRIKCQSNSDLPTLSNYHSSQLAAALHLHLNITVPFQKCIEPQFQYHDMLPSPPPIFHQFSKAVMSLAEVLGNMSAMYLGWRQKVQGGQAPLGKPGKTTGVRAEQPLYPATMKRYQPPACSIQLPKRTNLRWAGKIYSALGPHILCWLISQHGLKCCIVLTKQAQRAVVKGGYHWWSMHMKPSWEAGGGTVAGPSWPVLTINCPMRWVRASAKLLTKPFWIMKCELDSWGILQTG